MPTRFVGIHLALAIIVALFGLSFIADPCGGGGDLCLGGALGLFALGAAGVGAVGLVIWRVARRASPLLVWDCALLALSGFIVLSSAPYAQPAFSLGALLATVLSLAGAVLAGREVAIHRIERLLTVAALIAIVVVGREAGIVVLALTLLALGVGWQLAREQTGEVT